MFFCAQPLLIFNHENHELHEKGRKVFAFVSFVVTRLLLKRVSHTRLQYVLSLCDNADQGIYNIINLLGCD